jgi:hypothetical protein
VACRPARGDVEQLLREKKVHKCGGWLVKEPTQVRRGALKGKVKLAVAERSRAEQREPSASGSSSSASGKVSYFMGAG